MKFAFRMEVNINRANNNNIYNTAAFKAVGRTVPPPHISEPPIYLLKCFTWAQKPVAYRGPFSDCLAVFFSFCIL